MYKPTKMILSSEAEQFALNRAIAKAEFAKSQPDARYYIQKILPEMESGSNDGHIEMVRRFIEKPVEFQIDRNSANDIYLRGSESNLSDMIGELPYNAMAINLNRELPTAPALGGSVTLKRIYLGTSTVFVPESDELTTLRVRDFGKRVLWFIENGTSWEAFDKVFSTEPEYLKQVASLPACQWLSWNWNGTEAEIQMLRGFVKETGATAVMDMLDANKTGYEEVKCTTWFAEFEHSGSTYHIYDWVNDGSLFDLVARLNSSYFDDGFNKSTWDFCMSFVTGFVKAWEDRQVETLEVKRKNTGRQRKATGKRYSTTKVLKYNPEVGAIVNTKVVSVSEEDSEESGTGSKKSPHDRRDTTWRVYVLSPRDGEEILDVKEIRGRTRYQVERPRRGSKVNGGALSIKGLIKAV